MAWSPASGREAAILNLHETIELTTHQFATKKKNNSSMEKVMKTRFFSLQFPRGSSLESRWGNLNPPQLMAVRLQELRTELTKWETEFARACNRKPDMRDASARPEIAAKYREVESLKRALEPPPAPPPPAPARKRSAFGFTVASRLIQTDPNTG